MPLLLHRPDLGIVSLGPVLFLTRRSKPDLPPLLGMQSVLVSATVDTIFSSGTRSSRTLSTSCLPPAEGSAPGAQGGVAVTDNIHCCPHLHHHTSWALAKATESLPYSVDSLGADKLLTVEMGVKETHEFLQKPQESRAQVKVAS